MVLVQVQEDGVGLEDVEDDGAGCEGHGPNSGVVYFWAGVVADGEGFLIVELLGGEGSFIGQWLLVHLFLNRGFHIK